ncbi:MAG: tetratricopeptide repeat protein [Bacteroidota bacterium]|jgi:tetratricopeptide (TPR) repeat protein
MKRAQWILIAGFSALLVSAAWAQTPEDVFNRGNELYRAGKYQDAAKEYEHIIKQGYSSAELYYNLGNAYYRNEQLARAILSYERATQLHPNDPDITHNLKLAYLKTIDRIEPVPEMFFIQWMRAVGSLVSPEKVRIFFILSWVLLFGSLATMYFILGPDILRIARIIFFVSFLLVFLWAAMLGIQSFQETTQDKAIITAQIVTAKSSPDDKSVDAFVIHEGVKVKLTDVVGDWVKITLVDGKVGWIPADQCERI